MKEADDVKAVVECFDSKALYDSMLKVLDTFLLGKVEEKEAKIMDIEVEKRLEKVRKLLVKNAGIDSLEIQEINCKDLRLLNDNKKNFVEATLVFHDEVKQKILQDEDLLEEKSKQGRSDLFDVEMESSASSKIAIQASTKIKLKVAQVSPAQREQDRPLSQGTLVAQRNLKPEWLDKFFRRTFFDPCTKHPIRRNDLNKYCIDCDASLCQYCLSLASHSGHRLLKIYRHVYKDVVPLEEIEQHIDCSKIQPYRCNRQMVIALSPLPHTGSGKTSDAACLTCKRKLIEYDMYKYCSITCKVEAFMNKQSDSAPPFLLLDRPEQKPEEESPSKKIRKRKGIPYRAPLS